MMIKKLVVTIIILFLLMSLGCLGGGKEVEKFEEVGEVLGYKDYRRGIILDCKNALINVSVLAPDLIRIRLGPYKEFIEDCSWAVVKTNWERVDYKIFESTNAIDLITGEIKLSINKDPCLFSFWDKEGKLIGKDYKPMEWKKAREGYQIRCTKWMPLEEHYYGFGEKTGALDKRRSKMVMWNTDAYGYDKSTDPLYKSIPFFIGLREGKAYGVFFDNTYKTTFDMGESWEDRYIFEAEGGELDYYFFYGSGIKKILERYTELTGRIELPPLWALGHQLCRYSYYPAERVIEVAERCRKEQIPCDVIYLDIHYQQDFKSFTWNKERFPDPKRTLARLEAMGFKVVTIVDPAIKVEKGYQAYEEGKEKDYFLKYKSEKLYKAQMWPSLSVWPDFTKKEVREWWGGLYKELLEEGVDGIWNDMNEPAVFSPSKTMDNKVIFYDHGLWTSHLKNHNIYALTELMGTYEGIKKLTPEKRPFVLSRAGYAGIQRYAASWTGDNTANWEHLALQTPMFLNLGLSGLPFVGSDIGGFVGSPSPELLVRWYEASAFVPFCREHTCIGTPDQEPWVYGEYYNSIIREYLRMRYELLPYLYNLFYESAEKGYPILRSLFFEFQSDENTYSIEDEFMLGPHILVAPVVEKGKTERLIYLPEGMWWDYWKKERVEGKAWINYEAPLDILPTFLREGSIIPMQKAMDWVNEEEIDELILGIYSCSLSKPSKYLLYEDDGESINSPFSITNFSLKKEGRNLIFHIEERAGAYKPEREYILLKFYGIEPHFSTKVKVNGKLISWEKEDNCLVLKIKDDGEEKEIVIS
jgi:alpha-glucosidase